MAATHDELLEILLRTCANAGAQPWYPAQFSQSTGVSRELVDAALDRLRLAGLVQLTPWAQGYGQGYRVTPHGLEVLRHPRLLAHLRAGEVPQAAPEKPPPEPGRELGLRAERLRDALVTDSRPVVTQILLALNILWFLATAAVYVRLGGTLGAFFQFDSTDIKLAEAHHDVGSLSVLDLYQGEWWRLLSYGFVHANILHIGMNMYALFVLGPLMERMWGRAPYLALYLVSCAGGGAFAVLLTPQAYLVGASGAICGLLGSMVTWLVLNKAYLPPRLVQAWQRNIVTNLVLIVIVSLMPGVSWAGHLGGGVLGAVIGVPLNLAHFGDGPRRWLGWLATVAVAVVGFVLLQWSVLHSDAALRFAGTRGKSETEELTIDDLVRKYPATKLLLKAEEKTSDVCNEAMEKFVRADAKPLDATAAAALRKRFQTETAALQAYTEALRKSDSASQPGLPEAIKAGLTFFDGGLTFMSKIDKSLEAGGQLTANQRTALTAEFRHLIVLQKQFKTAWQQLNP